MFYINQYLNKFRHAKSGLVLDETRLYRHNFRYSKDIFNGQLFAFLKLFTGEFHLWKSYKNK